MPVAAAARLFFVAGAFSWAPNDRYHAESAVPRHHRQRSFFNSLNFFAPRSRTTSRETRLGVGELWVSVTMRLHSSEIPISDTAAPRRAAC